jgi:hypothetical protein
MTDITLARLRELADWYANHVTCPRDVETAAALRAAADQREKDMKLSDALHRQLAIERGAFRDLLAAREALLKKCEPYILACVTPIEVARALAAEIAEALKEKDNG